MADSRPTSLELALKIERLTNEVSALQKHFFYFADNPAIAEIVSRDLAISRRAVLRARNSFRRLGQASLTVAGFIFVASLTALFAQKLSLLSGFIALTAALFPALVGWLFHMQADSLDLGDTDDD